MQAFRYTALIPPERIAEARRLGLTNFSGFVNERLIEFIEGRRANLDKNGSEPSTACTPLKKAAL